MKRAAPRRLLWRGTRRARSGVTNGLMCVRARNERMRGFGAKSAEGDSKPQMFNQGSKRQVRFRDFHHPNRGSTTMLRRSGGAGKPSVGHGKRSISASFEPPHLDAFGKCSPRGGYDLMVYIHCGDAVTIFFVSRGESRIRQFQPTPQCQPSTQPRL